MKPQVIVAAVAAAIFFAGVQGVHNRSSPKAAGGRGQGSAAIQNRPDLYRGQ